MQPISTLVTNTGGMSLTRRGRILILSRTPFLCLSIFYSLRIGMRAIGAVQTYTLGDGMTVQERLVDVSVFLYIEFL